MRIAAGIAICLLIVAILWRPESRSAPAYLAMMLFLICVLALTACGSGTPSETFAATSCSFRDTGEWRTRTERGSCLVRTPKQTVSGHETGGSCVAWSHNTIHERRQAVSCSKERWVRR
jgi:hypothetical protein